VIVSRENAEHYVWGGICDGWHLVKRADLSVIHERMPPGACEVRHYHNRSRQFFFVLSGTATLEINGEQDIELPHSMHIPSNVLPSE
jgi:mannose-6-phosphate isomerase-like protein (cupin superfamily)